MSSTKIGIIGLGLLGFSIAKDLKKNQPSLYIFGLDTNLDSIHIATSSGVLDAGFTDIKQFFSQNLEIDILVFAAPVVENGNLVKLFGDKYLQQAKFITDVGSVKNNIIESFRQHAPLSLQNFIPAHPIAGKEDSGINASTTGLFDNQAVVITLVEENKEEAKNAIIGFWQSLGAKVEILDPCEHDNILALTSHLPHLLSFCLVNFLSKSSYSKQIFHYASSGFKDFTRIAGSSPKMWSDISIVNKENIITALDGYIQAVQEIKSHISNDSQDELNSLFKNANEERSYFSKVYNMKTQPNKNQMLVASPTTKALSGDIKVPGDKSVSHRSVMLGSIAKGTTTITGMLEGEDNLRTIEAFRNMGVKITQNKNTVVIEGVGKYGLKKPEVYLDMGNSGTAMRLLSGILVGQKFSTNLVGDESLSGRPMKRIITPLSKMGADISGKNDKPPLQINGAKIIGINYISPVVSAQVKSSVLLAGLYAPCGSLTSVVESQVTRNHTEKMLGAFGVEVKQTQGENGTIKSCITSPKELISCDINVPSDISSAAFFIVACLIKEGSKLTIRNVGINPTRSGIIDILKLMGAKINVINKKDEFEPIADIEVEYSKLVGIDIPVKYISNAIDEFPIIFIAAALADGKTSLRGAKELRVKESDRLKSMADGLNIIGVKNELFEDGISIYGQSKFEGGKIDSHGDHRIAMAFAIASLQSKSDIIIGKTENISTSFPDFLDLANSVGLNLVNK